MPAETNLQNKWYVGYLICILAFAFTIWSFYPGMMSPDSIANLTQGRQGVFHDINSPLMSYIWGWMDGIVPGPGLMFVFQNVIFWTACAIFWRATNQETFWLGLALVLFALMPHILAQTIVVWKDVAMGVGFFMAAALLFYGKSARSRVAVLISPVFLFYGYAARLNAFPAVLPIAIWTGFVAARVFEIERSKFFAAVIGIAYFVLLSTVVYFVNYKITEGKTVYPFQQLYLYDLAAISAARKEAIFPNYVRDNENFSLEMLRLRYNERSVNDLIYPDVPRVGDKPPLRLTDNAEEYTALRQKWREAVKENPMTYLLHRFRVFAQLVGLGRSVTGPYWEQGFSSSPPEFRGDENFGNRILTGYFDIFRRPFPQTFFFRGFIWLALSAFFLYKAFKHRLRKDWDIVFVLSSSALLFTLAYFPTTPSTEFRYLFWPAIASAAAIIFGVYLLRTEKRSVNPV